MTQHPDPDRHDERAPTDEHGPTYDDGRSPGRSVPLGAPVLFAILGVGILLIALLVF